MVPQVIVQWIASAIITAFPSLIGGMATATAIAQFGVAVVISAIRGALTKEQRPDVKRELSQITERPAYRTVYGWDRAVGTPAPRRVDSDNIVACYILNSRPSYLPFETTTVFLDDRDIEWEGTPFNFDSDGGRATRHVAGLVKFWIGRGDQTSVPAEILSRFPNSRLPDYGFLPTDVWRGRTVIWCIFDAGDDDDFQENWPSNSPNVAVEGQWSYVWNPLDPEQSPDSPSTWKWSDNQALCTLDALRTNPIAPYSDDLLLLDTFEEGARRANDVIARKDGTTERRYRVGGTIKWTADAEIEDQIEPLLLAGASSLLRVGGKLGFKPGVWQAPVRTIRDIVGDEVEFSPALSAEDLPTEIRVSYVSRARGYEQADLRPVTIAGAAERNGGMRKVKSVALTMVQSATQAMRIKRIMAQESQRKRNATLFYPPAGFALTVGENHTLTLPGPMGTMMNGVYELLEFDPVLQEVDGEDGGGVALSSRVQILEVGPHIWDWDVAWEEEVIVPTFNSSTKFGKPGLAGAVGYEVGPEFNIDTGDTVIQRARWWFVPGDGDPQSTRYEWEYRIGTGEWETGGIIVNPARDASGRVHAFLTLAAGRTHSVRVRGRSPFGFVGPYRELTGIVQGFYLTNLSVTTNVNFPGRLTVSGTAPDIHYSTRVRLYRGAVAIPELKTVTPGSSFTVSWEGITAGAANFYVAPISTTGVEGTREGPFNRTIP